MQTILAVNCGSSSIKFKLFTIPQLDTLISGQASSVASRGSKPSIKLTVHHEGGRDDHENEEEDENMPYEDVFERIIVLVEEKATRLEQFEKFKADDVIKAVSHRVVHGGTETEPMLISQEHQEGLQKLDDLSDFAPLHILCFDTLFHSTLPAHVYTYPITAPKQEPAIPLRKYGAHGLSYAYILRTMSEHLGKEKDRLNLIMCHLGSGASVCMVKDGKSFDTSMGLTPLEGLPGGTRTGSIDPALIFHHTPDASEKVDFNGLPVSKGEMIMNKEGGLQAIAGTSNFGTIAATMRSSSPDPKSHLTPETAKLTYEVFLDRLLNFVGAYLLKLKGDTDAIVFSGGIGEKSADIRRDLAEHIDGVEIDEEVNAKGVDERKGDVVEISKNKVVGGGRKSVRIFVCFTDEEIQTAMMTLDVLQRRNL
ncbi:hypothetical protein FRB98_005881 [Tulasnella sp. 332]|nr:hypothetical protein FRB98_005881 [Tulasnella sp. 332]